MKFPERNLEFFFFLRYLYLGLLHTRIMMTSENFSQSGYSMILVHFRSYLVLKGNSSFTFLACTISQETL